MRWVRNLACTPGRRGSCCLEEIQSVSTLMGRKMELSEAVLVMPWPLSTQKRCSGIGPHNCGVFLRLHRHFHLSPACGQIVLLALLLLLPPWGLSLWKAYVWGHYAVQCSVSGLLTEVCAVSPVSTLVIVVKHQDNFGWMCVSIVTIYRNTTEICHLLLYVLETLYINVSEGLSS